MGIAAPTDIPSGYRFEVRFAYRRTSTPEQREAMWQRLQTTQEELIKKGRVDAATWTAKKEEIHQKILKQGDMHRSGVEYLNVGGRTWWLQIKENGGVRDVVYDGKRTYAIEGPSVVASNGIDLGTAPDFPVIGVNVPDLEIGRPATAGGVGSLLVFNERTAAGWKKTYVPARLRFESSKPFVIFEGDGSTDFNDVKSTTSSDGAVAIGDQKLPAKFGFVVDSPFGSEQRSFELVSVSKTAKPGEYSPEPFLKAHSTVQAPDGVAVFYDPKHKDLDKAWDEARLEKSQSAEETQATSARSGRTLGGAFLAAMVVLVIIVVRFFTAQSRKRDDEPGSPS